MNRRNRKKTLMALGLMLMSCATLSTESEPHEALIPYQQFALDNGLRVIVHEDRKVPIVAVNVRYRVGSKDEVQGKTGLAHLFEHLMFRGSEHFKGNFQETVRSLGGSVQNGYTAHDETHYFETVPTPALERVLWMEADRMGFLLGAVTQEVLDSERATIRNEKRQRDAGVGAKGYALLLSTLFPQNHPYHHMPMGSMDDLDSARLEDVHAWFKRYYGPNNAVVVLSGDIDLMTARTLMEKYFGDIVAGPVVDQVKSWIPSLLHNKHIVTYDAVKAPVIKRSWPIPSRGSGKEAVLLKFVVGILEDIAKSRLDFELRYQKRVAAYAGARIEALQLASALNITVDVRPGVAVADAERALDETLEEFLRDGPRPDELADYKTITETENIRGLVRVSTKGALLSGDALFADDPGYYQQRLDWIMATTPAELQQVAQKWLSKAYVQLITYPLDHYKTTASPIDRRRMPALNGQVALDLPEMQEAVLSNGLKVILAERHEVPIVNLGMVLYAGHNADKEFRAFSAAFTNALMIKAPEGMSASEFNNKQYQLGMGTSAGVDPHSAFILSPVLKKHLTESLRLWAMVITRPAFHEGDFGRLKADNLRAYQQGESNPRAIAYRILSHVLYGPDHPSASRRDPVDSLEALQLSDVKGFYTAWVRPDNATAFIVGDTTLEEIIPALEQAFSDWQYPDTPLKTQQVIEDVAIADQSRVILVDQPGALQTTIMVGRLIPSSKHRDADAFSAVNAIFGGGGGSRLKQNLRENNGWAYSVASGVGRRLSQRLWPLTVQVQNDKAVVSVKEILKEMKALTGHQPITAEELQNHVTGRTNVFPAVFEQQRELFNAMSMDTLFGYSADHAEGIPTRLAALQLDDVNRVARDYLKPETLVWVLVGDVAQFEQEIGMLDIGDVEIWSAGGQRIR